MKSASVMPDPKEALEELSPGTYPALHMVLFARIRRLQIPRSESTNIAELQDDRHSEVVPK
jgi:hypothetical protein